MRRQWAYAAALATLGAFALLLQLWLALCAAPGQGLTRGVALWRYFGYFTILTNLLVVVALAAWALGPRNAPARFLRRVSVQTSIAVAIVIVGIVYHALLANLGQPQGWAWIANQLLHTVMPLLFVAHWWFVVPKLRLPWSQVAGSLAYPAAYAAYALLRGAFDGWYPYPFIDVAQLGYPRVAAHACGLFAAFAVVALALVAVGRWQARHLPSGMHGE